MLVCEVELLEEDDDTSAQACPHMSNCDHAQDATPAQFKCIPSSERHLVCLPKYCAGILPTHVHTKAATP